MWSVYGRLYSMLQLHWVIDHCWMMELCNNLCTYLPAVGWCVRAGNTCTSAVRRWSWLSVNGPSVSGTVASRPTRPRVVYNHCNGSLHILFRLHAGGLSHKMPRVHLLYYCINASRQQSGHHGSRWPIAITCEVLSRTVVKDCFQRPQFTKYISIFDIKDLTCLSTYDYFTVKYTVHRKRASVSGMVTRLTSLVEKKSISPCRNHT